MNFALFLQTMKYLKTKNINTVICCSYSNLMFIAAFAIVQVACAQHSSNNPNSTQHNIKIVKDTVYKNYTEIGYVYCRIDQEDSLLALKKSDSMLILRVSKDLSVDTIFNDKNDYMGWVEDYRIFNDKCIVLFRDASKFGFYIFKLENKKWKYCFESVIRTYIQYGVVCQDTRQKVQSFSAEIVSDAQIKVNDFGEKYAIKIDHENKKFIKTTEKE